MLQPRCRLLLNRPIKQWNNGKQAEFEDRKEYKVNKKVKEMFNPALAYSPSDVKATV